MLIAQDRLFGGKPNSIIDLDPVDLLTNGRVIARWGYRIVWPVNLVTIEDDDSRYCDQDPLVRETRDRWTKAVGMSIGDNHETFYVETEKWGPLYVMFHDGIIMVGKTARAEEGDPAFMRWAAGVTDEDRQRHEAGIKLTLKDVRRRR